MMTSEEGGHHRIAPKSPLISCSRSSGRPSTVVALINFLVWGSTNRTSIVTVSPFIVAEHETINRGASSALGAPGGAVGSGGKPGTFGPRKVFATAIVSVFSRALSVDPSVHC